MTNKPFTTIRNTVFFFFLILGLSFTSCNSDPSVMGLDIIPADDEIFVYFDTSTVIHTYTESVDSIRSDEGVFSGNKSYNLLGSYMDPVFGSSDAAFATQLRLSKNAVDFGENFTLDSMVLYLELANIYGDNRQAAPQEVFVYQLTDTISLDESYNSNLDIENYYDENEVLADQFILPNSNDSIIAIKIDHTAFVELFTDTNNLTDNDVFLNLFKGLYIKSSHLNYSGSIMAFDMLSDGSRLRLYYHNYSESPIIPLSAHSTFDLLINEKCARVNIFKHDYDIAQNPIEHIDDTSVEDTLVYVQAMGGVRVKVDLPDILKWQDSTSVVISSARLVIPVVENSTDIYSPLAKLNLAYINDEGKNEFFPDLYNNGSFFQEYFNGIYNHEQNSYEFNIAVFIQKVISNEIPLNGFYIYPYATENPVMANRVILKGAKANDGIKLYITYIKL